MTVQRNVLDDVFSTPENEVRYFADVMSTPLQDGAMPGLGGDDVARIKSGRADQIQAAHLTTQHTQKVVIQHGWDGTDYAWHIQPHRTRRGWQVSLERVIYAIAKTMNDTIPQTVSVSIFKPFMEWEIKEITFKAIALKDCWNVTEDDIEKLNARLFEVLGALT